MAHEMNKVAGLFTNKNQRVRNLTLADLATQQDGELF